MADGWTPPIEIAPTSARLRPIFGDFDRTWRSGACVRECLGPPSLLSPRSAAAGGVGFLHSALLGVSAFTANAPTRVVASHGSACPCGVHKQMELFSTLTVDLGASLTEVNLFCTSSPIYKCGTLVSIRPDTRKDALRVNAMPRVGADTMDYDTRNATISMRLLYSPPQLEGVSASVCVWGRLLCARWVRSREMSVARRKSNTPLSVEGGLRPGGGWWRGPRPSKRGCVAKRWLQPAPGSASKWRPSQVKLHALMTEHEWT